MKNSEPGTARIPGWLCVTTFRQLIEIRLDQYAKLRRRIIMTEGLLKKTIRTGAQVAGIGIEAARMKERVGQVVDDQVTAARRAAKQGRYAAEDFIEEATH